MVVELMKQIKFQLNLKKLLKAKKFAMAKY